MTTCSAELTKLQRYWLQLPESGPHECVRCAPLMSLQRRGFVGILKGPLEGKQADEYRWCLTQGGRRWLDTYYHSQLRWE